MQLIMPEQTWQLEHGANTGCMVPTVRKQEETDDASQSISPFVFGPELHRTELPKCKVYLPSSVKLFYKHPHRYNQKCFHGDFKSHQIYNKISHQSLRDIVVFHVFLIPFWHKFSTNYANHTNCFSGAVINTMTKSNLWAGEVSQ